MALLTAALRKDTSAYLQESTARIVFSFIG